MWQPTATIEAIRKRGQIVAEIRTFFAERNVLEVDTPALSHAATTDLHLHSFATEFVGPGAAQGVPLYLMTSPEFHMKRLLSAGSGAIYQICKAFRNEEAGRFHNPEFSILEWYRPDFDHHALMDEMDQLLQQVLGCQMAERLTYAEAFFLVFACDPLTASMDELRRLAPESLRDIAEQEQDKDTLLQLLFAECVEPVIGQNDSPCFIYHFPASQAALARISVEDPRVAERFEVYFKGIELANGFHELADANEQRRRFQADNQKRLRHGLPQRPIDNRLLDGLAAGFPDCAGVALGIDRLVMLALAADSIAEVIAFPTDRA
ncbi:elongation factor P--(R)-beta-lysine ligase [Corallincola holothuriorum]|uniref:Elongation factor P--(R)-beta-lysine ligase n=1 Tax=Corallincola holothuriorum TaxID=2282215 RepID=A0A368N0R5_9GAMM|nr:elongation factor P--(R)-beta-lysine ligase [Corallincola holothuriorum]RCU43836.1 elongation factor P--(R)-beta-lysine ligase [Corallincola holothuriorum]